MGERLRNLLKVILSIVGELGFELGDPGSELLTAMLSAFYKTSVKKRMLSCTWRLDSTFQAHGVKHTFLETRARWLEEFWKQADLASNPGRGPWPHSLWVSWKVCFLCFDLSDPHFPDLQNRNVKTPSLMGGGGGLSHKTKQSRQST